MGDRVSILEAKLAAANAENQALRDRLDYIETTVFGRGAVFPIEWKLEPQEAKVLAIILGLQIARRDAIMTALYSDRCGEEPEQKIIDIFVSQLRRKIKPFGITIRTIWNVGYAIDEPDRSRLKATYFVEDRVAPRRFAEAAE